MGRDYIVNKGSCFISFLSQKKKKNYIIYKKDITHFWSCIFLCQPISLAIGKLRGNAGSKALIVVISK